MKKTDRTKMSELIEKRSCLCAAGASAEKVDPGISMEVFEK